MRVALGAPFCREVEVPLAELKRLIPLAKAAGIDTASFQAVYDDLNGYLVYVPLVGDACEKHTREAQATVAKLRVLLNAMAISTAGSDVATEPAPQPLRPDYRDPDYVVTGGDIAAGVHDPEKQLVPAWLKWTLVAGASAFLLAQLAPIIGLLGSLRKPRLAGYSRRHRVRRKR